MEMKTLAMRGVTGIFLLSSVVVATSCLDDEEKTIALETSSSVAGIPDDSEASANPVIVTPTTNIPNIQTTLETIDGYPVVRIDMTGVQSSSSSGSNSSQWMRLYGTGLSNQNVWVEVDDVPKGITVVNTEDETGTTVKTDIVFAVDNSGSMSQEADAIARDIISWSEELLNSGLDAKFGVVGYEGPITGAMNLTDATSLSTYLNGNGTGTSRTYHFGGSDAETLQTSASSYTVGGWYECGAAAIQYADANFAFRANANRVYVNFTDEPNQPNGKSRFSVKFFESQTNWPASKGTVHTVYSASRFETNTWNQNEQPWLISDYTGGTYLFATSSFTGITLSSLPVTGAMQHSYVIKFTNIDELLDGNAHKVHITVKSEDGSTAADKIFYVIFQ